MFHCLVVAWLYVDLCHEMATYFYRDYSLPTLDQSFYFFSRQPDSSSSPRSSSSNNNTDDKDNILGQNLTTKVTVSQAPR